MIVTSEAACTVMPPVSSLTLLPDASEISTAAGPSLSANVWPPGVEMVTDSVPSVSSSAITSPDRVLMTLRAFRPPPSIDSGPLSVPFQSAPSTHGRSGCPPSNAISTSSPGSGISQVPRPGPAISVASRAHASYLALSGSPAQGSATFTRPCPSGSRTSVTSAG